LVEAFDSLKVASLINLCGVGFVLILFNLTDGQYRFLIMHLSDDIDKAYRKRRAAEDISCLSDLQSELSDVERVKRRYVIVWEMSLANILCRRTSVKLCALW
jgi:hypothetical protein